MLELQELDAGYRAPIIQKIAFTAQKGELIALLGANGSGKTALLKTIAGLLPPLNGKILVSRDKTNLAALSRQERAALISFLPQKNLAEWAFTVRELVSQGCFLQKNLKNHAECTSKKVAQGCFLQNNRKKNAEYTQKRVENALAMTDLSEYAEKLVTELSGGEFQRVLIARSLAQNAPILLLDEPISGLDPKFALSTMVLLKKLAKEQEKIVIMSLHDLVLAAKFADRAVFISQKTLALIAPREISPDFFYK